MFLIKYVEDTFVPQVRVVYLFPTDAVTMYHKLNSNANSFSWISGGQKPKMNLMGFIKTRCQQGLVPSGH